MPSFASPRGLSSFSSWGGVLLLVAACGGRDGAVAATRDPDATPTPNACGGATPLRYRGLPASPGDPCGPCRDGALVCASPNVIACVGALPPGACPDAGDVAAEDASAPETTPLPDSVLGDDAGANAPMEAFPDATTTAEAGGLPEASGPPAMEAAASPVETGPGQVDAGPWDAGPGWQATDAAVAVDALSDGGLPAVRCLELATEDLVLDPTKPVLYATVPSTSPVFGNNVVRIEPATLTITGTVFAGSDPRALAVSDDGASLYVGEDGAASVRRVDLGTGGVDAPVYLGTPKNNPGVWVAHEIRAVPGSPTQYVVCRANPNLDPGSAGLALYDGPTLVGEYDSAFTIVDSIAFASPTVLYGQNNATSGYDLSQFNVGSGGVQLVSSSQGLIVGYNVEIVAQGGWIFSTSGQVVDGATGQPAGTYAATGPVWPDPGAPNVWYLELSGPSLLEFDRNTFVQSHVFALPAGLIDPNAPVPVATSLVGWSNVGFAFRTPASVCQVTIAP